MCSAITSRSPIRIRTGSRRITSASKHLRTQSATSPPNSRTMKRKILHAEETILALETRLFNELRLKVAEHAEENPSRCTPCGTLDCLVALATIAVRVWIRLPGAGGIDGSRDYRWPSSRDRALLPPGEKYTPNDVHMNTERDQILIVTGPNMSGSELPPPGGADRPACADRQLCAGNEGRHWSGGQDLHPCRGQRQHRFREKARFWWRCTRQHTSPIQPAREV